MRKRRFAGSCMALSLVVHCILYIECGYYWEVTTNCGIHTKDIDPRNTACFCVLQMNPGGSRSHSHGLAGRNSNSVEHLRAKRSAQCLHRRGLTELEGVDLIKSFESKENYCD